MSLFQCFKCGCVDNTALGFPDYLSGVMSKHFDWSGREELEGKSLCSACAPDTYKNGEPAAKWGKWHDVFDRTFLPLGMFKTNSVGNLEHIETGETDYRKYEIEAGPQ